MSVSTLRHRLRNNNSRPQRFNWMRERKRAKDMTWWHGWLTRPISQYADFVNGLDGFDVALFIILAIMIVLMGFCLTMAFLSAFNMPRHNEIIAVIELQFSR